MPSTRRTRADPAGAVNYQFPRPALRRRRGSRANRRRCAVGGLEAPCPRSPRAGSALSPRALADRRERPGADPGMVASPSPVGPRRGSVPRAERIVVGRTAGRGRLWSRADRRLGTDRPRGLARPSPTCSRDGRGRRRLSRRLPDEHPLPPRGAVRVALRARLAFLRASARGWPARKVAARRRDRAAAVTRQPAVVDGRSRRLALVLGGRQALPSSSVRRSSSSSPGPGGAMRPIAGRIRCSRTRAPRVTDALPPAEVVHVLPSGPRRSPVQAGLANELLPRSADLWATGSG